MPVMKSSRALHAAGGAIVLDLADLNRKAETILSTARAEAERIVADARVEAQRLVDGAAAEGRAAGHEDGMREGREAGAAAGREDAAAEMRDRLGVIEAGWTAALERWERERGAMLLEARRDVLDLALAVAERILRRTVAAEPERVVDQVGAALGLLAARTAVRVAVHPEDRAPLEAALPGVLASVSGCSHAELVEDETIGRGGCVVATADGRIDATLRTQLDRIVETLLPGPRHEALAPGEGDEESA